MLERVGIEFERLRSLPTGSPSRLLGGTVSTLLCGPYALCRTSTLSRLIGFSRIVSNESLGANRRCGEMDEDEDLSCPDSGTVRNDVGLTDEFGRGP